MPTIAGEVLAISVGLPQPVTYREWEWETAIYKHQVQGPVFLTKLNIEGDKQGDLKHHGGLDKAVNVYSYDHYPYWEQKLQQNLPYSAFGENLTVRGLQETDVCIGDIYQIGEAVLQVSEARVPCQKLSMKLGVDDFPTRIHQNGYSGFYFRVLEEGLIGLPDNSIRLLERHPQGITLAAANHLRYHDKENVAAVKQLLAIPELSASWRRLLTTRLETLEQKG